MNRLHQERLRTVGYVCDHKLTGDVNEIHGDGILGDLKDKLIKKFLGSRPKIMNDMIKADGKEMVVKVQICRKPITRIYEKLLNFFTLGELKRKMKDRDYDRLFHLYVILHLSNGTAYKVEKNQRIKIVKNPVIKEGTECKETAVNNINLETFITAPERVNMKDLYRYHPFQANCQDYVKRLLNANGIMEFNKFIMQRVSDLAPPILQSIARGITDVAGVIDYTVRGGANKDKLYEAILNS